MRRLFRDPSRKWVALLLGAGALVIGLGVAAQMGARPAHRVFLGLEALLLAGTVLATLAAGGLFLWLAFGGKERGAMRARVACAVIGVALSALGAYWAYGWAVSK